MTLRAMLVLAAASVLFAATPGVRAQCRFAAPGKLRTVTYRFSPSVTPGGLVLHVTLAFREGRTGQDTLVLPTQWAGETLHAVTNLHTVSPGAALLRGADPATMTVSAPPGRPVVVAYDLTRDWTGRLVAPLQFHPVLMPDYLQFTGSNALVRLKLPNSSLETADFDWRNLPGAWTLATSFGTTASTAHRCQSYTGPWRRVDEGLYAAGDYRIHWFQIDHRPAVLAVRGAWTFTDQQAIEDIQNVVGVVRSFWHDDNFPYFLVTLSPYDQDHGDSDGSQFTNAFWMYVSRLDSLNGLLPQLAHESFHAWDPARMGAEPADYDGRLVGWFNEGATDFYAHRLTYQAGEISAAAYVDFLNKDLREFPVSTSEYVRGAVISLWLDGTIRRESHGQHSLDDVMFDMIRDASQPYTLARILATAGRYLSPPSRALLQRAVSAHGDLPAPDFIPTLGPCARASLQQVPTFDLGFDFTASQRTRTVTGVARDGPAFAAGLRDGQPFAHFSIYNGQPDRLAKFKIPTPTGDKEISFYPRGKPVPAWQYRLDPDLPCDR